LRLARHRQPPHPPSAAPQAMPGGLRRGRRGEAKQSLRFFKRLLRRWAPRNDRLSEQIFDYRYKAAKRKANKKK